jgi:hypothetical protein
MLSLFARDRFGKPQLIAIAFLLVFMAQCSWSMAGTALSWRELANLGMGSAMWQGETAPMTASRVVAMAASAGAALGNALDAMAGTGNIFLRWGARLPFLGVALLLGGSLWYVARRLYGNSGGYIALALYCFSPTFVRLGAEVNAYVVAQWSVFGVVFGAIASAHTLYAPLTWKQRAPRALLLGTAIALAAATTPGALVALAMALAFMMYLTPGKRMAALAVFGTALAAAFFLLLALWFFDAAAMWRSFSYLSLEFPGPGTFIRRVELVMGMFGAALLDLSHPALFTLLLTSLVTYAAWKRARYFGNTAPLSTAAVFIVAGLSAYSMPEFGDLLLLTLPFVFVFMAGVFADLVETRKRRAILVVLVALLVIHAAYGLADRFLVSDPGFRHPLRFRKARATRPRQTKDARNRCEYVPCSKSRNPGFSVLTAPGYAHTVRGVPAHPTSVAAARPIGRRFAWGTTTFSARQENGYAESTDDRRPRRGAASEAGAGPPALRAARGLGVPPVAHMAERGRGGADGAALEHAVPSRHQGHPASLRAGAAGQVRQGGHPAGRDARRPRARRSPGHAPPRGVSRGFARRGQRLGACERALGALAPGAAGDTGARHHAGRHGALARPQDAGGCARARGHAGDLQRRPGVRRAAAGAGRRRSGGGRDHHPRQRA